MLYPFSRLFSPARPPCAAEARKKKGFNLIEAAIVLGVVGLVIGGIWVAAAAVMENKRISDGSADALTIASNMRNVLHDNLDATLQSLGGGANINITAQMQSAGVIPASMTPITTAWGAAVKSTGGQTMMTFIGNWGAVYGGVIPNEPLIMVSFNPVTRADCSKLILAITSRFSDSTYLRWVQTSYNGYPDFITFPVPASPLPCGTGVDSSTAWVSFSFSVR